ncbi:hypothetical protein QVD17_36954 [Tagetes erecta]|uniref:Uncharacterized protein n=1 Tax=Tagetes erecta TaxID=13708 RepID=A0AAD8NIR8_TARER|nr:hypothetical protein QVD17_36954 [Tagetes erecta]
MNDHEAMKDPDSEWKMEEYSSSSKEDDEDEAGSIVKWLLKNGYVIGRRIIVTGIMISSATLVVPPLVAFSAMGVVISAPFGFLFGTYACTNKLITILLPDPDPLLMLEYNYAADYDCMQLDAAVEDDYGPEVKGYFADEEDKEQIEGISHSVEIELDDYKQAALTTAPNYVDEDVDGIREMEMEDVMQGESLDIDAGDDYVEEDDDVVDKGTGEQTRDDAGEYYNEDDEQGMGEQPLGENENKYKPEGNEDVKSKVEWMVIEDDNFVRESSSFGDVKDVETTEPVTFEEKDIEHEEDIKQRVEMVAGDEQEYVEDDDNSLEEENKSEEPLVNDKKGIEDDHFGDDNKDIVETTKPVMVKEIDTEKLVPVGSKNNEPVGEMHHVSDINADVLARSPLKQTPLDTKTAEDASKAYKKMPSKKDDERMWEKIIAMRRIVGYKAPSEATCIGELKALYVFTGVEPPALSDEGDSDLDDKLNFLMAIIGVK